MPLNEPCQRTHRCEAAVILGLPARVSWMTGLLHLLRSKLVIVLFMTACLHTSAKGYTQTIVLAERNTSLQVIFKKIEHQTNYLFWYEDDLIKKAKKVTISIKSTSLSQVLNLCLKDQPLSYTIIQNTVVIKQKRINTDFISSPLSLYSSGDENKVTGLVINDRGEPVRGATIQVKGSTEGTSTNDEGHFIIQAETRDVLLISSVEYLTREITVPVNRSVTVTIFQQPRNLNEVVITALGIKKDAKRLGYAATTVNTENLAINRTVNLGNSLEGKVAGVNVSPPAGGPGSSSKIRIRGQSSFGGNNNPLIIVNGIPINNTSNPAGTGLNLTSPTGGSADGGDGLQSINQDDIESMTVLKGAAAAALYGFRAKDGVIIITTKTGAKKIGIGVEVNSNFQVEQALDFTDFQYLYGQGEFGKRPASVSEAQSSGVWSFGEKFDGRPSPQFDGSIQPYLPHKNRIKNFYRLGSNWLNSIALSGGNDKGNFRLSFANTDAMGIMPNSDYHKKIVNLGLNYRFTNKLSVQVNANYSNEFNHNPSQIGIQDLNANSTIYTMANSIDVAWLKNRKDANGDEMPLSRFTNRNNPYWVAYDRFENIHRDRVFGNASIRYQLTKWIYMQGRYGQDYFTRPYDYNRPTGTRSIGSVSSGYNGYYYQSVSTFRERNMDLLLGGTKTLGSFGLDVTFGGNRMQQVFDDMSTAVNNFFIRDLYTVANGQIKTPNYTYSKKRVNSLYGTAEISYKRLWFVNVTARNDWFSTLNPRSNNYLYPSVSSSFIFSDLFKAAPSWLDYGKLRAAYAEVGGDTDPYANALYYSVNPNTFNGVPIGSISGNISPNANLRPLKVKEAELGLEIRALKNRVHLDLAAYRKTTVDEILNVDISNTSGYSQTRVNIGKLQNKGFELLLDLIPVRGKSLTWESSVNGSYNVSKVLQLANDQQRFDVGQGEFFGIVSHELGLPLASLRGFDYKRDEKGNILLTGGKPMQGNLVSFGSAIPKWVGGWLNTIHIKGFRVFTQIDFKAGHKIMSNSNLNFLRHGLSKASLNGREGGVLFPGVNADGTANTNAVEAEDFYSAYRSTNIATPFVYSGSFVRWRSVSVGYNLSRLVQKSFIKGLTVSVMMNNVLMIKKYIDNLDPEAQVSTSDNLQGIETHTLPTTRSYGMNINLRL